MGKKRGRPKKDPAEVLGERMEIRLSVSEKERFEAAAANAGMPMSDWIRKTLNAAARKRRN